MLEVQRFLRSGGTVDSLLSLYSIKARRHQRYPNLVCLKYDQIASPFGEQIVRECRGIVLDEADGWRVVSMGFTKFFNYGEGHAAEIAWSTARVQEKVDGSLCVMYPYRGEWHVATTGTPDGSGDVNGLGMTFAELFWKTYGELRPTIIPVCFFFELTSPYNRIVVPHAECKLTLLGARDLDTLQEYPAHQFNTRHAIVREFHLQSFDAIVDTFDEFSPLSQEGYVVVDGRFNRVKVKHPGYVALHHLKGGLSRKRFVEIARSGETSEVTTAFPEFAQMLDDARARVEALISELVADYERIRDIPDQKSFAIEALKTRCSGALFAVRAKKTDSFRSFVRDMRLENLMDLLGYGKDADNLVASEEAA